MITIEVQGRGTYLIEFRHMQTEGSGHRLHKKHRIRGITQVAVSKVARDAGRPEFTAQDCAVCILGDRFCYRDGRIESLRNVLHFCPLLRDVANEIWAQYLVLDPEPAEKVKVGFSAEEKQAAISAGSEKRAERAAN